jgi:hypothetical protein
VPTEVKEPSDGEEGTSAAGAREEEGEPREAPERLTSTSPNVTTARLLMGGGPSTSRRSHRRSGFTGCRRRTFIHR